MRRVRAPRNVTRSLVGGGCLVTVELCDRCARSNAASSAAADAVAERLAKADEGAPRA